MKKIVICIPWFWPAYKAGGPIQSIINLVTQFKGNCRFYIFTSNSDLGGEKLTGIETNQWIGFNAHTKIWYASQQPRAALKKIVKEIAPDHLFIIGLFSPAFNIFPLLGIKNVQKILSPRGMLHPGALRQKALKKYIFLSFFKKTNAIKSVVFHATDAEEEKMIKNNFGRQANVKIASNFPRLFSPVEKTKANNRLKLISIALISPMKNHLLVLEALQKCTYTISYAIYGPVKNAAYWQQCKNSIRQLPENVAVQYHGILESTDVAAALQNADVFILPSKSENFAHAICEALSAGLPVITSHFTPWNQLQDAKAGLNVDLTSQDIVSAIDRFAKMDTFEFSNWSFAAAGYIQHKINSTKINEQYHLLFNV